MTEECRYFESQRWTERTRTFVDRLPLRELLEIHPEVEDPDATRSRIAEALGFEYGDRIDDRSVSDVAEASELLPTTDPDEWFAVWRSEASGHDYPDRCGRDAVADGLCAYHLPPDHDARDADGRQLFHRAIEAETHLVGARFDQLSIPYARVGRGDTRPIDLRHAEFDGVDASHAEFENPLYLDGIDAGQVRIENAALNGTLRAVGVLAGGFDATGLTSTGRRVDLRWADVASLTFREAVVDGTLAVTGARISGRTDWRRANVGGRAVFDRLRVDGGATFRRARFTGESVSFKRSAFEEHADFESIQVDGNASWRRIHADGGFDCSGASVAGNANFSKATFDGRRALFAETRVGGTANFGSATFASSPRFLHADLSAVKWVKTTAAEPVRCTNATVDGGRLIQPEDGSTAYDFTGATIGDLSITTAEDEAGDLGRCRFYNTTFTDFPFDRHSGQIDDRTALHDYPGPDDATSSTDLVSTYVKAKNGAKRVGADRVAADLFVSEMRFRRDVYRERVDRTSSLRAAAALGTNLTYALTMGYGERPMRTVVFSFGVVAAYAALYLLIGLADGAADALNVSFQAFVSLLLGTPGADRGVWHELLVASEAFLGAFCIALFVFTLTRSVRR